MATLDPPFATRSRGMLVSSVLVPAARPRALFALAAVGGGLAAAVALAPAPRPPAPAAAPAPAVRPAAPSLPALYVPNTGQSAPGVRFEAHGADAGLLFRAHEGGSAGTCTRTRWVLLLRCRTQTFFSGAAIIALIAGSSMRPSVLNVLHSARVQWPMHLP